MDISIGNMVRVSDSPNVCGLYPPKKLLGRTPEGGYIVMSDDGSVPLSYMFAKKVEVVNEKGYKTYDADTFPRGMVWFRCVNNQTDVHLVVGKHTHGIMHKDSILSYEDMLESYEVSLNGELTWEIAGVRV